MKKKVVRTKKNTWNLKNRWDMEEWFTLAIVIMIIFLVLVQVLR